MSITTNAPRETRRPSAGGNGSCATQRAAASPRREPALCSPSSSRRLPPGWAWSSSHRHSGRDRRRAVMFTGESTLTRVIHLAAQ